MFFWQWLHLTASISSSSVVHVIVYLISTSENLVSCIFVVVNLWLRVAPIIPNLFFFKVVIAAVVFWTSSSSSMLPYSSKFYLGVGIDLLFFYLELIILSDGLFTISQTWQTNNFRCDKNRCFFDPYLISFFFWQWLYLTVSISSSLVIHETVYHLNISENFATIIAPELRAFLGYICSIMFFFCKSLITCCKHISI